MGNVTDLLPYEEWRPGQYELARLTADTINEGGFLLAGYPTGTGKTLAVLAGVLSTVSKDVKVLYMVRTLSQFQAPLRELRRLSKRKPVKAVTLVSKQRLCPLPGMSRLAYDEFLRYCSYLSRAENCPYLSRGLPGEALEDLPLIASPRALVKASKKWGVCPFRLAIERFNESLIGICAYSYLFDPEVRRSFLAAANLDLGSVVVIVDEAHNLPEYLVSALSVELTKSCVRKARVEVSKVYRGEHQEALLRDLSRLENYIAGLERKSDKRVVEVSQSSLMSIMPSPRLLEKAAKSVEAIYARRGIPLRTYLRRVLRFAKGIFRHDPRYIVVGERNDVFKLVNVCVSPRNETEKVFSSVKAAILMSGTLPPKEYMAFYTGIDLSKTREVRIPNPYAGNTRIVSLTGVSSRFIERSESVYRYMARAIDQVFGAVPKGVILAVFPSYDFMKRVRMYVTSRPALIEREDTSIRTVEEAVKGEEKVLVMAVAWGKIVEGVEFKGDGKSLINAIVIAGFPVPEPTPVRQRTLEFLSSFLGSREKGWEHSYMVPAVMRVVQAIGRGLRSPEDRVFVAVLDERVTYKSIREYIETFGYKLVIIKDLDNLQVELGKFFGGNEKG